MTKLTDVELNELVIKNVMENWDVIYNSYGYPSCISMHDPKSCTRREKAINMFNPCNDWNDAMMAANALGKKEANYLGMHVWVGMTARNFTETILEAAGVDVE